MCATVSIPEWQCCTSSCMLSMHACLHCALHGLAAWPPMHGAIIGDCILVLHSTKLASRHPETGTTPSHSDWMDPSSTSSLGNGCGAKSLLQNAKCDHEYFQCASSGVCCNDPTEHPMRRVYDCVNVMFSCNPLHDGVSVSDVVLLFRFQSKLDGEAGSCTQGINAAGSMTVECRFHDRR